MNTLIIDDSKAILAVVASWLELRGYQVTTAESGEEGLQRFSEKPFDLVVLDVEMPRMNGFQVASTIRELETQWTPIVFMSGSGKESYYQKGINSGGDFYFTKPLNEVIFNAFISGIERMHEMRTQLQSANTELSTLRENTHDGIIYFDRDGLIFKVNPSCAKILSNRSEPIIGSNIRDLLQSINADKTSPDPGIFFPDAPSSQALEYEHRDKQSNGKLIEMSITHFTHKDKTVYTGIMRDITERKQLENRLKYLAQYDTLTGLPNRALFLDRLNQSLNRAQRSKTIVALLFIDLDRFKIINDTLGHDSGDILLTLVARRLK